MTYITSTPETENAYSNDKETATQRFLQLAKRLNKNLWTYTEETSETDTTSFKGLL